MSATSPLSSKQFNTNLTAFKVCFVGAILFSIAAIVLGILQTNLHCSYPYQSSCTGRYQQCNNRGEILCCHVNVNCGDSSYCYHKYSTYSTRCTGLTVAFYLSLGMFIILSATVFTRFFMFRRPTGVSFFNEENPTFSSWIKTFRLVQYYSCPYPEEHQLRQFYISSHVEPQLELQRQNPVRLEQLII